MRAVDRITRRGRDAAASADARGTLRRNDAGELVPLAPPASGTGTGAGAVAGAADASPTEARQTVRQIDGQGWAR